MAGGTGGQKGHRLDAVEPAIAEEPRQFERPAEITPATAAIVGRIKSQHEHAAFVAPLEPVELPQDGRLHLSVAGAGDRQPHFHGNGLHGVGRPSRHDGGRQRGKAHGTGLHAAAGDELDRGNHPAVTHCWP